MGQTTQFDVEIWNNLTGTDYTGYATFETDETIFSVIGRGFPRFTISYTPKRPGNYTLAIDLLSRQQAYPVLTERYSGVMVTGKQTVSIHAAISPLIASKSFPPKPSDFPQKLAPINRPSFSCPPPPSPTEPSPEAAVDKEASSSSAAAALDPPHRCSGLPDSGEWMRCTAEGLVAPYACLRWGWTFRPDSGCYYDNWSQQELSAYATAKATPWQWIVFVGSSKLRGVFLSAADYLVKSNPGEFLAISKCWGRMDVQLGHFKLTYLDYRMHNYMNYPIPAKGDGFRECHGDNVVIDGVELIINSTACIHRLLESDQPPTSLVIDWSPSGPKLLNQLLDLPESWKGELINIYFRSQLNYPMDAPKITEEERQEIRDVFKRPVEFIDMRDIAGPWLMFMEVRQSSY